MSDMFYRDSGWYFLNPRPGAQGREVGPFATEADAHDAWEDRMAVVDFGECDE